MASGLTISPSTNLNQAKSKRRAQSIQNLIWTTLWNTEGDISQTGEELMTSYMVALNKQLRKMEKHVTGTRSRGLDGPVHDIQPGDCVYVKPPTEKTLEPQ